MKTILFIDSSGRRYFQCIAGVWHQVTGPTGNDMLWVLVNLPAESMELIDMPRIIGRDRSYFLERRLKGLFPESTYRTAHILSGGFLKPGKVMLSGLTEAKDIVDAVEGHEATFVGLWGTATVLGMMARRLVPPDVLLILPSAHELRIIAIKGRVPVLTRYVFCDGYNNADEILLTRNYLEDQLIFENGAPPPVLFLGDSSSIEAALAKDGLTLLPVPKEFLPKGEAGWLHPLFNHLVSSPPGQLAPLSSRTRYFTRNVRRAAYGAALVTLLGVSLYGQGDWQGFVKLELRKQSLQAETSKAATERERLQAQIKAAGVDPELVRRATEFAAEEITAAPDVDTFFSLAAAAIADVPEARVKSLTFTLVPDRASSCQHKSGAQAGLARPAAASAGGAATTSQRQAEIELTVMLPSELSSRTKAEARQRITEALKGVKGSTIWQDPTTDVRGAILKGGTGVSTDQAEYNWCLSVSWKPSVLAGQEGGG